MPPAVHCAGLRLLRVALSTEEAFVAFTSAAAPGAKWQTPLQLVVRDLSARKMRADEGAEPSGEPQSPALGFHFHPASSELCCLTAAPDATALRYAALMILSGVIARHAGAAARLLDPSLTLALPMRLVSTLQASVHELIQLKGRQAPDTELGIVSTTVLLLLELARGTSMHQELEGGSWKADLSSVTAHLVTGDLHPALAHVSLPAKILQNTVCSPSPG